MKFLLVSNRNHNPTYERDSVVYKDEFFVQSQKVLKKGLLETPEQQKEFYGKFDWWFMTRQDMAVWNAVADHLRS